jgi:hypothetical protein
MLKTRARRTKLSSQMVIDGYVAVKNVKNDIYETILAQFYPKSKAKRDILFFRHLQTPAYSFDPT